MGENEEMNLNESEFGSILGGVSDVVSEVTEDVLEDVASEEMPVSDSESDTNVTVETGGESLQESTEKEIPVESGESEAVIDGSTYETLQEIHTTLLHVDSVSQYGVSVLIVLLIIVLLNYVYKFFKMFF